MTKKKDKKLIVVFLLLSFYLLSLILSLNINFNFANAQETIYSNVLSDLQKDESFKKEDYPVVENDFSLKIIQIAESEAKELFVYVYQPCPNKDLKATTINISTSIDNNLNFKNYKLDLLNSKDVFYKFKVLNFDVSEDLTRYYEISSIYRAWQEDIDEPAEGDNTISEVAFAVNSLWTAKTENDTITYQCMDVETVGVTDKYVGFVRYRDGFNLWPTSCDSHFVAFSTDKSIDKLVEADVFYTKQKYSYYDYVGGKKNYVFDTAVLQNYVHLTYDEKGSFEQDGLFSTKYEWNRIVSPDTFIENENIENIYSCGEIGVRFGSKLTEESKSYIKNKDWVLRFTETDYSVTYHSSSSYYVHKGTLVGDVSILRLKFETDGVTYNLGVIDNKQTGDGKPDNDYTVEFKLPWWLKILIIAVCVVVFAILAPWLIPFLFKVIAWVFKGIWWFITLPFRIFKDKS